MSRASAVGRAKWSDPSQLEELFGFNEESGFIRIQSKKPDDIIHLGATWRCE